MKFLRLLLFVLTAGILLTSCQKEFSAETGSAQGVLVKDAAGNCTASVNGAYKKDTLINATNFVDVQINFTQVGVYIINTDTVNGYYFRAAGVAAVTGLNTVRLFGTGKPIAAGTDNFVVSYAGSTCDFATNVTIGTGGGGGTTTAVFTFPNAAACTGASQMGIFYVGVPTTPATHNITLLVNVQTPGSYNLATNPVNGLTFSGSGTLAVGNNQPIILTAVPGSAPTAAVTTTYTFSTTTPVASSCGFDLNVLTFPTTSATYTFNCSSATVNGTYQIGATMVPTTNFIKVPVTVGTPGSYNISVNANGVTFTGIGVLTATPIVQNITFVATGIAGTTVGIVPYALIGGGGANCSVSVPFIAPPPSAATDTVSAFVNGTFVDFDLLPSIQLDNTSFPGYTAVLITSDNSLNVFEAIQVGVGNLTTGDISVGTYNVNQGPATLVGGQYTDGNLIDYTSVTGAINPTPAFSVTITSKSGPMGMSGTRVKGTFTGAVKESPITGTSVKTITGGYFDLTFP
jgi:hypothetical protein